MENLPVIILAGGLGTRLLPHTKNTPKCMVKVAGKPFLFWQITQLQSLGFHNFIISTGYQTKKIEDYLAKRPKELLSSYIRTYEDKRLKGAVNALAEIFSQLNLTRSFVINGDTYIKDIKRVKHCLQPLSYPEYKSSKCLFSLDLIDVGIYHYHKSFFEPSNQESKELFIDMGTEEGLQDLERTLSDHLKNTPQD